MVGSEAATKLEQEQKMIFSIQAVLGFIQHHTSTKSTVHLPVVDTQMSTSGTELIVPVQHPGRDKGQEIISMERISISWSNCSL